MCHSVEIYMPKLARDAAEHRLGAADLAAARRERAIVRAAWLSLARLWRGLAQAQASVGGSARAWAKRAAG
jgi:hypothetical protein